MSRLINFNTAKVCYVCMKVLPLSNFYPSKLSDTGYTKYCISCGVKPGNYRPEARYNQFTDYQ